MPLQPDHYADRTEAGEILADACEHLAGDDVDLVVLALPRGGLPVAAPVCRALPAPLDVVLVRKLGVPWQPELAMGAVASVGFSVELIKNQMVLARAGVAPQAFTEVRTREIDALRRREEEFRRGRAPLALKDRTVIVVDDGLATGSTMLAATQAIGRQDPSRIVIAVPVAPTRACAELEHYVDEVICPMPLDAFDAVGQVYDDFDQVPQERALEILRHHAR